MWPVTDSSPEPRTTTFADLGLRPELLEAPTRLGYEEPTPIQAQAIGPLLEGHDVLGQAETGTGKTAAFALPLLQRIPAGRTDTPPVGLVLVPTRELAIQVSESFHRYGKELGARVLPIYGGQPIFRQLRELQRGVDVVVATPGRALDHITRESLRLDELQVVVLDEADEMLDLGFLPDVERLLAKTPETRQTMLFSATMPAAIVALARTHMRHPMNIRAESSYENATVPATAQFIYQAHDLDKAEMIGRILQAEDSDKIIVFTRTKRQAQRVADDLTERGFDASPLHGDMAQVAREKALTKFREGKLRVLVATDVAARGIDVAGVSHVINYTCPEDEKTYVHRIGRTGRAGATGVAVTLVDWADLHRWKMINKALDLPFDDPPETYSTSEHFAHDLGIPPGTKGRVVPEKPREPREPREGRGEGRGERSRREGDRPRRERNRTRTRGGRAAEGDGGQTGEVAEVAAVATGEGAETGGEAGPSRNRRRRRRRSGGGGAAAPEQSPTG